MMMMIQHLEPYLKHIKSQFAKKLCGILMGDGLSLAFPPMSAGM